ncbi:hypothetical protein WJ47_17160 [Burkholderia ubonensis]|uniref:Uncharacterized protein n=2 Tax=Burkholderia ubonensis TaxID=101571 RepID=A0AB73G334_9BURK|nr:hypothetical protein WJ44_15260 [Burkholderia ubonensis]KVL61839.1 hypothetical protein WJ47_17160 [Burkholderia ubonensis]KVM28617.1 hypothetical protein WJ53_09150 [Burkholderia ubonensis]KVM35129.1 hypothetical protein WJ54_36145 [Burkholderia ubonensis]
MKEKTMSGIKLSFGEEAFMRAVLEEAGPAKAGRRVPFNHMEGRTVSGLAKKGFVVRLDGEVEITDVGAAWLATVRT